jgi:dihydropyrimidine dehydrogenase (NAD+) subunit PreA
MGVKIGAGAVDLTKEFVHACSRVLKKPFSVKITPQTSDSVSLAKMVEEEGASAINLSARLSGIMLDIDTAAPIGWESIGGYGGPYLLGYGLKTTFQVAKAVKIPIIGGLGVWKWQDVIKYIMVGASIVQTVTAVMLRGFNVTGKWMKNIEQWMDAKGYKSINDIKGIALENIKKTSEVERDFEGIKFSVDTDLCSKCGVCLKSCMYEAISLTSAGAVINDNLCDRCGMCSEVCPQRAVRMYRNT